jgi:hypothetical protein
MPFSELKSAATMAAPTKLPNGTTTTRRTIAGKTSQTKFFFMLLISSSDAKRLDTMKESIKLKDGIITIRKKQASITPKT